MFVSPCCPCALQHFYACVCTLFGREKEMQIERERKVYTQWLIHMYIYSYWMSAIRCHLSFCSYFVYSPFLLPYRRSPTPMMRLTSPTILWWQMVDGWTCMFWRNRSVSIHCMCETTCLYFPCLCYSSFHFNFVNDVVHVACT